MEKKFYQTPEFRKLECEWERKLAADGFSDIEETVGSEKKLAQYALRFGSRQEHFVQKEAKIRYFQLLQGAACQAHFDNDLDRLVMSMKAEGARITEICRVLLKKGILKYRGTIRLIIRKYENRWGIRNWKPEQLDYNLKKKKPIR